MPELMAGTDWLWAAFQELSERRGMTDQGPESIKVSELHAYVQYQRIEDAGDREVLLQVVGAMDRIFVEHVRGEMKRKRKKPTPPAKGKRR